MSFGTGKVRTNSRLSDQSELGIALIGSNMLAGSFFPAAAGGLGGASVLGGGVLIGSFAGSTSGAGWIQLSALGAISQMYGTGNLGIATSGYKILPFAFLDISGDGVSATVFYTLSVTQAIASNDSVVIIAPKAASGGNVGLAISARSVHFVYFAFVISAPA